MKATDFLDEPVEKSAEDFLNEGVETSALRRVADVGISALKGAIGVPESAVGLADLATGGYAGKLAEDAGFRPKEAKAFLDEYLSPQQQAANKALADTKGFLATIGTAVKNPSTILHSAVESLPLMGAGGVAARGLMAVTKAAPVLAGAVGEGVASAGQNTEQVRQETPGGLLSPKQVASQIASGIGTGAFALAGGKLAQKLKIADIDTMLAQGSLTAPAGASAKGFARRLAEGAISEGVFEELPQSLQEQMWQNYATDRPIMERVPESGAMGMLTGAVMGGPAAAVGGMGQPVNPPAPPPPQLTPREKLLHDTAEAVKRREQAEAKLSEAPPAAITKETQNDEQIQHPAASETRSGETEANASQNANAAQEALLGGNRAHQIEIPRTMDVGQPPGNGEAVGGGNTQPQEAAGTGKVQAQGPDRLGNAVVAPATVAGAPESSRSTAELQAIVQNPETPANTRYAAIAAIQAKNPEPRGGTPVVDTSTLAPSGPREAGVTPGQAPALPDTETTTPRPRPIEGKGEPAAPLRTVPVTDASNQIAGTAGAGVVMPAGESVSGQEVDRFQGQYNKGMSERVATTQKKRLAAEKPGLAWAVEKSTVPEFPDRFDVVARKLVEGPKTAQLETPAGSVAKAEIAVQAPAAQSPEAVKEPWQMDQDDYVASRMDAVRNDKNDPNYGAMSNYVSRKGGGIELSKFTRGLENKFANEWFDANEKAAIEGKPVLRKPNWMMTRSEFERVTGNDGEEHEMSVRDAMDEGKPVPSSVLAEYPALSKPSPSDLLSEATDFISELNQSRNPAKTDAEAWQRYQNNVGASRNNPHISKREFIDAWQQMQPAPAKEAAKLLAKPTGQPVGGYYATDSEGNAIGQRAPGESPRRFQTAKEADIWARKHQPEAKGPEQESAERAGLHVAKPDVFATFAPWVGNRLKEAEAKGEKAILTLGTSHDYTIYGKEYRTNFNGTGDKFSAGGIKGETSGNPVEIATRHGEDNIIAMTSAAKKEIDERRAELEAKRAEREAHEKKLAADVARTSEARNRYFEAVAAVALPKGVKKTITVKSQQGGKLELTGTDYDGLFVHKIDNKNEPYSVADTKTGLRVAQFTGIAQAKDFIRAVIHANLPRADLTKLSKDELAQWKEVAKAHTMGGEAPKYFTGKTAEPVSAEPAKAAEPDFVYGVDKNGKINRFSQGDSVSAQMAERKGWRVFDTLEQAEQASAPAAEKAPITAESAASPIAAAVNDLAKAVTALQEAVNPEAAAKPGASEPENHSDAATAETKSNVGTSGEVPTILSQKEGGIADKNIQDFGQRIEGARKDYAAKLAEAKDADIAAVPLSQSWPEPDYAKLLEGGADPWGVAFMHAARDEIPTKPSQSWKLQRWTAMVEQLRDVSLGLAEGTYSVEKAKELLTASKTLKPVADRVDIYQEVGHEKSLKGIRISEGVYSMYDRIAYDPPKVIWSVESKAPNTAMSRWPKMLATGDTREQAIANFKKSWLATTPEQDLTKAIDFQIYSGRTADGKREIYIGKKIGKNVVKLKGEFADVKEARAWKAENQAELAQMLERYKDVPYERKETNSPRVGVDHRNGANVTPEQFTEAFGFRGVQFGNYVEGGLRQQDLNEAYDALTDLAGVLGVPTKALSLNGELGLAFGARGTGGKQAPSAHYEPGQVVINLTKARGAGSLAHEWFHGVDNYFSRLSGAKGQYLTETQTAKEGVRPEMVEAFKKVMQAIRTTGLPGRSQRLDNTRSKPYWSTKLEMAARSFETYIVAKLQDQNAANDYLANIVSEDYWKAATALGIEKDNTFPYPTTGEMTSIRAAFDHFFQTVETKETDKGTALYSRAGRETSNIDTATRRMGKFIDEFVAGRMKDNDAQILGPTPTVLQALGAEQRNLEINGATVNKVLAGKHKYLMTPELMKQIPASIYDPLMVFDSPGAWTGNQSESGKLLLTELRDRLGNPVVVAVHLAKFAGRMVVDDVASVYSMEDAGKRLMKLAGHLEYFRNEESLAPSTTPGQLNLPDVVQAARDSGATLLSESDVVKQYGAGFSNAQSSGTTDTITPEMRQRGLALRARITEMLGDRPDLAVKTFMATPESPIGSYSRTPFQSVISMALNAADQLSIADHEGYHAAEDLLLSKMERQVVAGAFKPGRPLFNRLTEAAKAYDDAHQTNIAKEIASDPAEARAYGYELWKRGNLKAEGVIGRIFDKLRQFFDRVANAARGLGFRSAEDVFTALDRGQFAERTANSEVMGELAMQSSKSADYTNTPEFKKWFGDSKVVDAEGKPLVVYHGTGGDYAVLDPNAAGTSGLPRTTKQKLVWFTENAKKAEFYTTASPKLRAEFDRLAKAHGAWSEQAYPLIARINEREGATIYPVYLRIKNPLVFDAKGGVTTSKGYATRIIKAVKDGSADGAIIKNVRSHETHEPSTHYVVFSPTQIKSAIGNTGAFDPNNPDIRYSRAAVQGGAWNPQNPSKLDNLIYTLQDKQIDTRRVLQAIRDAGKQVGDALDVYLQEELFHGRAAKETQLFIDDELKPLITEMAARNVTIPEFEEYLHARHAEEANAVIATRNPDMPDGGSGINTKDAQDYLATLDAGKKRAYEALAKRVDAINDATRQLLVDYELESQDTIDTWKAAYKNYVPLHREDMGGGPGIGQGFSVRGPASKMRTGSQRTVVDILGNIAMQREKAIVRGEKNVVSTALYGLAKANPNPDFWKLAKPGITTSISAETGDPVDVVDMSYQGRDNVVMSRALDKDGKIVQHGVEFNVHNERALRMALALKNLDTNEMGEILSASAKATRYFASINTQFNPIFGVVNLTRDSQQAMFNLSTTPIAGKQAEVAKYTLSALKGIYLDLRAERSGQHPSSAWAQLFEEFQKEGGQTGYRDMFRTGKDRAEAIQRELERVGEGKVKHFGRAVFGWLSDYNSAMENAVRLAAYKVGKESGMTNQRAASMAKNLTVNFNRKGQIGMQAGALYAFFNASVQGSARLAETLAGPLGRKIIIGGITLGSIQALMLAAAGFDDDEPPQFVRERSTIIPIGDKKYITIPMPLGLHFIPNIGRIGTEFALSGFKHPGKRVMDLANVFADAFNPVGSAGLSLQTITPTVIDPFAALAENKDWTGKPIARQDMSQISPTPGHTRAKETASYFSKTVSKALNYASGGTDYKPGLFSPTPDQIDYLLGQATGGVGREAMKVEQSISSVFSGEELPTYKIPLVGRFYGNAEQQSSQGNAFYNNLKAINEHEAEIKGRRKAGEPLGDYVKENPEARLIQLANATERQVSLQRKRKRELIAKDADKEAIKAVDLQITAKMKAFNDRVKQVSASAQ